MRILVVEDCTEIRAAMVLSIKGVSKDIEVVQAGNGLEAVELLESSKPFDIVFCDFNMPKMNGGEVYLKMKKAGMADRFVLVSSDTPDVHAGYFADSTLYIEKPNIFKPIIDMVAKLCGTDTQYISVSLRLVEQLNLSGVDLFIRLSDKKFVKVVKAGSPYFLEEIQQLMKKPLAEVYIDVQKAEAIFEKAFDSALDVFESELTPQEHVDANEVLMKAVKFLGVTEETQKMVEQSVSLSVKRIGQCQQLKELIREFKEGDYVTLHSTILAHLSGYICSFMKWCMFDDLEKLAMAALLHDITVDDSELAKVQTRQELEEAKKIFDAEQIYRYINHPVEAGKLARSFDKSLIPPGVDQIIVQHHERPDGTGFPKKVTSDEIDSLSAVFIVSHAIAKRTMVRGLSDDDIKNEISQVAKEFVGGPFNEISQVIRFKVDT